MQADLVAQHKVCHYDFPMDTFGGQTARALGIGGFRFPRFRLIHLKIDSRSRFVTSLQLHGSQVQVILSIAANLMTLSETSGTRNETLKMSSDLAKAALESSPFGVMSLDAQGKIHYVNPALENMLGIPESKLLGHDLDSMQSQSLKGLFGNPGLLEIAGPEVGRQCWLQCSTWSAGGGSSTIRFFTDATELVDLKKRVEKLEQRVEELTITDDLTGLANQRALSRALSTQVTRSRRYQNPLSLALVEIVDESGRVAVLNDESVLATSRYLRDRLRWVDMIARWDENHFVIILPETHHEQAADLISEISRGFSEIDVKDEVTESPLSMRYGVAQWMKGNDSRILLERAAESLADSGRKPQTTH